MGDGGLPFLRGRISETQDYRSPQGGGGQAGFPRRNAREQSRRLQRQLETLAEAATARAAHRDAAASREIVAITPAPGFDLKAESLGDKRTDVRVIARDPASGTAVVDTRDPGLVALGRKVLAYGDASKRSLKGRPKNEAAVAPIETIRLAELPDLAGPQLRQAVDLDPAARRWFELGCRGGSRRPADETGNSREQIQRQLTRLGLAAAREFLVTEHVVFYLRATLDELRQLVTAVDCCYEVDLAEPQVRDWLLGEEQPAREIRDFVLGRPSPGSPSVVLLDTGIRTQHPLLSEAILSAGSVVPGEASPEDSHRHGTEMAGVLLYGDGIGAAIENGAAQAEHWLQSIRLLTAPQEGAAAEDNRPWWPQRTKDAVDQAEAGDVERKRAFTLAVTCEPEGEGRSLWSTAIDQLAFNSGAGRVMCLSAGNADVDNPAFLAGYPQLNLGSKLKDPAQAFNALTVGAFTEKTARPPDRKYQDARVVAPVGGISPSTSAGPVGGSDAIKPDVVFEGGNVAVSGVLADPFVPTLCTLTSGMDFLVRPLSWIAQTSEAVARAARLAALVWAPEPNLRPETVRGLIVHAADWTASMRQQFPNLDERLAVCGYGAPAEDVAVTCALERATVIVEDEMPNSAQRDIRGKPRRQVKFFRLPIPDALSEAEDADAELRVTLSYFSEPHLARRRVARGLDLKWDMQGPGETKDAFEKRVNLLRRDKGTDREQGQKYDWEIGPQRRGRGTVQSDRWHGRASVLAGSKLLAVAPVLGWWDDRIEMRTESMRFSLIVSLRVANVDVYNPIAVALQVPVEVDI